MRACAPQIGSDFDAVILLGRSFCHLVSNHDIYRCLDTVYQLLRPNGLFLVDNFNAHKQFSEDKPITSKIFTMNGHKYKEVSRLDKRFVDGWVQDWHLQYYIGESDLSEPD